MNNNSVLYEWTLSQAKKNYQIGETYYNHLKDKFLDIMESAENDAENLLYQNFVDNLNNMIINDINNFSFREEEINLLFKNITQYIQTQLNNGNLKSFQSIITKNPGKTKTTNKNYLKNFEKRVREQFENVSFWRKISNKVEEFYKNIFQTDARLNNTSLQYLLAFTRRNIIAQVSKGNALAQLEKSLAGYKQAFRGELREELVENIFNFSKAIQAKQIGGQSSTLTNKQTSQDIILGTDVSSLTDSSITNIIDILESFNQQTTFSIDAYPLNYFSAQVKSWSIPNISNTTDRIPREIGSRKDIYDKYKFGEFPNQIRFNRGWHYSAKILSQEITKVLGRSNVLYFANNKFYWTAQVISAFKSANYFLTFQYSRKTDPTTRQYIFGYPAGKDISGKGKIQPGDVAWQKQIQKNTYKLKK